MMVESKRIVRFVFFVYLILLAAGCKPAASPPAAAETPSAQPAAEDIGACETHTAEMQLSVPPDVVRMGETVEVEVQLHNTGCLALGLPQYRLIVEGAEDVLAETPEPIVHTLAVAPGMSDTVRFELTAAAPGEIQLRASANFEVHVGHPGPAYWGSAVTGEPVTLTVAP